MADWEITKPLGRCYGTDEEIAVGQEYFAALVETDAGFERRDFSAGYWEEQKPEVYCFWKTKMAAEGEKKRLFVDDDMLMTFFERLEGEEQPEKVNFRFVLTLILMRKRMLRYDESEMKDGSEWWTLKVRGQDRKVEVLNPQLTEEQIEELSSQMGQILQMDFD